ncbi:MAG TPA: queuosine precursor transporter [Rectinemataceae bacterium]
MNEEAKMLRRIERPTTAFITLSVVYGALLIVSNIIVVKLLRFGPFLITAAFFTYPAVYVISDIMTEVYGFRLSMKAIRANFIAQALVSGVLALGVSLSGTDPGIQEAMKTLFSTTWRIVLGSLAAYWVGDWLNSLILSRLKVLQKGNWFIVRAMGSSIPAHFIDTALFTVAAFWGIWPAADIGRNVLSEGILASAYELILFPLTYFATRWWKKKEGVDAYDDPKDYMPFGAVRKSG